MQLRERSQKNFANVWKFNAQSLKKKKKFSPCNALFSSKSSFGLLKFKFSNHASIFSKKIKNVLFQGPNLHRKSISFYKKGFSSKKGFFENVKL